MAVKKYNHSQITQPLNPISKNKEKRNFSAISKSCSPHWIFVLLDIIKSAYFAGRKHTFSLSQEESISEATARSGYPISHLPRNTVLERESHSELKQGLDFPKPNRISHKNMSWRTDIFFPKNMTDCKVILLSTMFFHDLDWFRIQPKILRTQWILCF